MANSDKRTDENGLPFIDPVVRYDTNEAAELLGESPELLRQWRFRKAGPKYYQPNNKASRVHYLGQWLIEFRNASIVTPEQAEA
jgi:hypothetical protein